MSHAIIELVSKIAPQQTEFFKFLQAAQGGNNKVLHKVICEAIRLDENWINTVERNIHHIEQIVKHPKSHIKDEEFLVDVERAKRTTASTVRHLSANTKYIRSIEEGNVTPSKLLITENIEQLAIYENRFIVALIKRLRVFVEQRYQAIMGHTDMYDMTDTDVTSQFKYGDSQITARVSVVIKELPHDTVLLEHNTKLIDRINIIRRRLRILEMTEFFKVISQTKPVRPPIVKTNLIKMNVDYSSCYKLWLFLASYKIAGYSVEISEKDLPIDNDYYEDLTTIIAISSQSMFLNNVINRGRYEDIPFKAPKRKKFKVVTTYDKSPQLFDQHKQQQDGDTNEYYFVKIQEAMLKNLDNKESNTITDDKQLATNFLKFVRSISAVNKDMYDSMIYAKQDSASVVRRTPLQRKRDDLARQTAIAKKCNQLAKAKQAEIDKITKQAAKEQAKLEKLKLQLDTMKAKQAEAKARAKQRAQAQAKSTKAKQAKSKTGKTASTTKPKTTSPKATKPVQE